MKSSIGIFYIRKKARFFLGQLLFLALFGSLARAQVPSGYYDLVDDSSSGALKASLHEIIDDHLRFPYTATATDTWDIINVADEDALNPNNILDIYLNASYPKISGGTGAYNREHSWPKSYGFPNDNSSNYPYTDAHHLFASDSGYNSSRSNNPFRDCDASCNEKVTQETNGRGGGSGVYPGNSNWARGTSGQEAWQTWVGRKGDVARAMFYMAVRYEGGVHGITGAAEPDLELTDDLALINGSNTGSNESLAYMGILSELVRWHQEDPVDAIEMRRNDVVYGFQGNRNPFIDNPAWADCLFGNDCEGGGGGGGGGDEFVVVVAGGEEFGSGTVSGNYTDTYFSDNVYQTVTERESGGRRNSRTSLAEHTWLFSLPAGKQAELTAELAFAGAADDENFILEISMNGSPFEPVFVIEPSNADQVYQHLFSTDTGGTLFMRLRDGDRTYGARQLDSIRIDSLRITYNDSNPVDTIPPDAPAGLTAVAGDNTVALSWFDNAEPDLAGYAVYRSVQAVGPFDVITGGLLTEPTYTDTTAVNGVTYYYAVTAVDIYNNESDLGNAVEASPESGTSASTFTASTLDLSASGRRSLRLSARAIFLNDSGEPVSGALVTGTFSGAVSETQQVNTDASGIATFRAAERVSSPGSAEFCIDIAVREGLTYEAPQESCTSSSF